MSARDDYYDLRNLECDVDTDTFVRADITAALDEVDRLRAQLERTRAELAEATVRLAEWDRMNTVLAAVLPALEAEMPERAREAGP